MKWIMAILTMMTNNSMVISRSISHQTEYRYNTRAKNQINWMLQRNPTTKENHDASQDFEYNAGHWNIHVLKENWGITYAPVKGRRWDIKESSNSGDRSGVEEHVLGDVQNAGFKRIVANHTKPAAQLDNPMYQYGKVLKFIRSKHLTGKQMTRQPVKRFSAGLPAGCVMKKKKVLRCRTIKYRGRGITYCWYENVKVCSSVD